MRAAARLVTGGVLRQFCTGFIIDFYYEEENAIFTKNILQLSNVGFVSTLYKHFLTDVAHLKQRRTEIQAENSGQREISWLANCGCFFLL